MGIFDGYKLGKFAYHVYKLVTDSTIESALNIANDIGGQLPLNPLGTTLNNVLGLTLSTYSAISYAQAYNAIVAEEALVAASVEASALPGFVFAETSIATAASTPVLALLAAGAAGYKFGQLLVYPLLQPSIDKFIDKLLLEPETTNTIQIIAPSDPNDILGPDGYGEQHWVNNNEVLPYTIRFENQPTATAPARQVTITLDLDSDIAINSFRLGDFGWGDIDVQVPEGVAFYVNRIDLTATKGFLVDVVAGIDVQTHQAFWTLTAIDPNTGEVPDNPLVGFLPPNGRGHQCQGDDHFRQQRAHRHAGHFQHH
jgi:hypothetical protein